MGADPPYSGCRELDDFIAHPATPEETDWQAIARLASATLSP